MSRSVAVRLASASSFVLAIAGQAAVGQTAPSQFTTAYRYDAMGRQTGTIMPDPDGAGTLKFPAVRNSYDAAGRLVKVETGELSAWQSQAVAPLDWTGFTVHQTVEATYDALDRRVTEKVTGSFGVPVASGVTYALTQYSYDAVGRLECTAVRMNPAIYGSLPASACTLGTEGTQGSDRIMKNVYDAAGQMTKAQKAVGTTLAEDYATYTYSANGKRASMTDARGYRADFTYDGFDRQKRWYFPSKTTTGVASTTDYEEYGYDANGNRTSLRKRDGSIIAYTYDALNRVTFKNVPTRAGLAATHVRDVYYGYDLQGLQLYARFDSASGDGVTISYDGFGRVISNTLTMDGVTRTLRYAYDAHGNRVRMSFPDGDLTALTKNVTYGYDGLDRPITILRENTATIASYGYNAAGKRSTFNGGISTSYGYDVSGRLSSLTNNPAVNTPYNNNWTFAYNPASQITQTTRSNDNFAWTGAVNVDRSYTTNGINQYTAAGTASFSYDNNGNLTSDGSSTYNYDIENRLVTRVAGGITTTLRYDPLGRLYEVASSTGTTRFLQDGDALVGEYNTAGTLLRRYVHGTDGATDDPVAWYEGATFASASERVMRSDWQGSIVLITDSTGNTVHAVNRYDEYGIPQGTNTGRFQYTGQIWLAELGMYYYKARIYSPTLGRFLQTDPIGYEDQVNLYAYVANDPLNKTDPTGKDTVVEVRREGFHTFLVLKDTKSDSVFILRGGPDGNVGSGYSAASSSGSSSSGSGTGGSSYGSSSASSSERSNGSSSGAGGRQLIAETRPAIFSKDQDSYKNPSTVTMASTTIKTDFGDAVTAGRTFTNAVNDADLNYRLVSQNSNSVAGTGFEVITGQQRPDISTLRAPAFDVDLCNGGVKCAGR